MCPALCHRQRHILAREVRSQKPSALSLPRHQSGVAGWRWNLCFGARRVCWISAGFRASASGAGEFVVFRPVGCSVISAGFWRYFGRFRHSGRRVACFRSRGLAVKFTRRGPTHGMVLSWPSGLCRCFVAVFWAEFWNRVVLGFRRFLELGPNCPVSGVQGARVQVSRRASYTPSRGVGSQHP